MGPVTRRRLVTVDPWENVEMRDVPAGDWPLAEAGAELS
jgi:hypothetical protein